MTTILIIEDEDAVRHNLEDLLTGEGYNTLTATNGSEGYEIAVLNEPDLILSDIRMPQLDGLQLLEKLQKNPVTRLIPFIFLTARVEMKDLREGMSMGADDYIMKPFKIDDVLNAINSRLRKKENYLAIVNEFKNVLMKRVPHELRTPLVGILGMTGILCDDIENISKEDIKEIAERIQKSGNRLHRRIEKFLTYTELLDRSRTGDVNSYEYEIVPEELSKKLLEKAELFRRKNDLSVYFEKALLKIDSQNFEILINELSENSFKFTGCGSAVSVNGESGGDNYKIKISDSGINGRGINIDDIKAFNKFGKKELTEEGMGMGLAIVKKIIDLHKGYLKFEKGDAGSGILEVGIPLKKV